MASNWDRLDLSLRDSVQENVELYERVRPALKLVTREVLLTLRTMLKGTEVTPLFVTGRTKTVESFREKISRTEEPLEPGGPPVLKFPDPFRTLNDMVGIRVITKLPAENAVVANLIKRQRQLFDCRGDREKDIGSIESGTYGYSSRHLILRTIQNEAVKDYQHGLQPGRPAERQLLLRVPDPHQSSRTPGARLSTTSVSRPRTGGPGPRTSTASSPPRRPCWRQWRAAFSDLHERYEEVRNYWDVDGEGGAQLTPNRIRDVWRTLLPHVDRKVDDDWGWAAELLAAHGLNQTMQLAGLLQRHRHHRCPQGPGPPLLPRPGPAAR